MDDVKKVRRNVEAARPRRALFSGNTEVFVMFEKVKELLVEELSVEADEITPSAELVNDLGINSLELADLVMLCEDKFGVTIDDDDAQKFVTVGDVAEYLAERAD